MENPHFPKPTWNTDFFDSRFLSVGLLFIQQRGGNGQRISWKPVFFPPKSVTILWFRIWKIDCQSRKWEVMLNWSCWKAAARVLVLPIGISVLWKNLEKVSRLWRALNVKDKGPWVVKFHVIFMDVWYFLLMFQVYVNFHWINLVVAIAINFQVQKNSGSQFAIEICSMIPGLQCLWCWW